MRHLLPLLALLPFPAFAQEGGESIPPPAEQEESGFFDGLFGADEEQEAEDEGFLTRFIEERLSATARDVDIRGFAGALSSRATIDTLTIADGQGVWLRATDLALQWDRSALLSGRVVVEELTAASIEVLRAPVPDAAVPRPEATPFSLPELPVSIEIGNLQADRIILGEDLLGEQLVLSLDGGVNLSGGEGTANLSAEILQGSEGRFDFAGGYSNETRILSVALDLEEAEGGLAARALDLPGLPSVALRIEGTAPIDNYEATLSLATAGEQRVAGTFALQTTEEPGEGYVVERAFGLDVRGDVTTLLAPSTAEFFGPDVVLRTKGIRRSNGSLVLTSLGIRGEAVSLSGQAEITPEGWPARIDLRGRIGTEGGEPVPLPGAPGVTVRGVDLDVTYDRAQGETWTGTFAVDDLARAGLTIDALTLDGGGIIEPATATEPGRFTADLAYGAQGLAFTDAGLGAALGADLSGRIDLIRPGNGGPLRIRQLTLSGPGIEAQAEGTVAGAAESFLTQSSIQLEAQDLARFGTLTGLDLGGSADVTVVSAVRPLDGIFSLVLSGTTQDLALGVERLDPLLAGAGEITLNAARDEAGLRVPALSITTDAVTATGDADISSGASQADFDLAVTDLGLAVPQLSGPGTVRGSFRRDDTGAGTLDAQASLPGATVSLDATLAASTLGPQGREIPGLVTFDAQATVDELSDWRTLVAGAAPDLPLSGAAELSLSGTTALDADRFDVVVEARTQDLAIGQDAFDAAFAGEALLQGRAIRSAIDTLRIEDLHIDTPLLDGTLTADLAEGSGTAELDLALTDVEPILGGIEGPGRVTGTAARADDGTTALDLDITLPTGTASVDGTLATDLALTGDLTADFEEIAPLGTLLGRDLAGALEATATGTIRPDLSLFDLTLEATTRDLALGLPPVDALLQGEGTLSGRAARTGPASFAIDDLRVTTDLLSGTVTGAFQDGEGTAELDLSLPDVAPVLGGLSGSGRIQGTATGSGEAVALDLTATLPTGTASVDGTLDLQAGNAFTGDLAADFSDIAPLGPLLGRDLGGAMSGTASGTLRPDLSALDLSFDATTRDLRLGVAPLDPLLAGPGTFTGSVLRTPEGDLAVDVEADTPLLRGQLEGNLGPDEGSARFDIALADVSPLAPNLSGPASATGTATRAADGSIALDADVTAPGTAVALDATIAPPGQGSEITGTADLALADLSLLSPFVGSLLSGSFDGTVTGSALPDLSAFDLALDGTATNPSTGNETLARVLAGTGTVAARVAKAPGGPIAIDSLSADFPNLDVSATGTSQGDTTTVRFDAALADAALFAPAFPGAVSATGTATLSPAGTTLDAQVTGPGGLSTRVAGPVGAATDLSLTGEAPLALFNRIIDPRRLDGPAAFDLRLTGPSLDALQGAVTLAGARLSDPGLGEAIRNIQGTATLGGGTATLDLTGDLALGGRLAVTGPVGIQTPFDANLTILGSGLVIRDPALYEAVGDARLTVTGALAGGALIAGVVDIQTVEGLVPSTGVGALGAIPRVFHIEPSLPVVETLQRAGLSPSGEEVVPATGAERGEGGTSYLLDVLLNAPDEVFIRGRGLDAELGGQLRLTGNTNDVIPIGQFSLLRGRLDLLGQRFELTEGQATIQGDFNPFIRVVAETEARTGTQIAVVLEGPLASPTVSFTSTPLLPEDEVLAQLLFGVEIEQITPLQAIRLAGAVATLAGEGSGLLGDLRGGFGLADFDVTTTQSGDIALRLGQYISENVYTDVIVSPEETEATINLDLSRSLTVRAGVSTDGETTLGIFFERDY